MPKTDAIRHTSLSLFLVAILAVSACTTAPASLEIYFIDVEGGQATLVVTPGGESLLIDAGYPGQGKSDMTPGDAHRARDAGRIAAAATDAGISTIDYLLVTHFHADHFGGVMELAQLMPIGTILDHGTAAVEEQGNPKSLELIRAYKDTRAQSSYRVPSVAESLNLDGVRMTVVSSAGDVLESPIKGAGAPNDACDRPVLAASNPLNPRSTGILLQFGEFRFLDLGDLVGQPLSDLVCPINHVGAVDVYLVTHHGGADAADPATFAAFRPRVAILNNGPTKGGDPLIFEVLRNAEGLEDTWQLHRSEIDGAENFPPERIANQDTQTADWLRLSAYKDGSFRIRIGAAGPWTQYGAN